MNQEDLSVSNYSFYVRWIFITLISLLLMYWMYNLFVLISDLAAWFGFGFDLLS